MTTLLKGRFITQSLLLACCWTRCYYMLSRCTIR